MTDFKVVHTYNDGAKHIRFQGVSLVVKAGHVEWSDNWPGVEDLADQGFITRRQAGGDTLGHTNYHFNWDKVSEQLNGDTK